MLLTPRAAPERARRRLEPDPSCLTCDGRKIKLVVAGLDTRWQTVEFAAAHGRRSGWAASTPSSGDRGLADHRITRRWDRRRRLPRDRR